MTAGRELDALIAEKVFGALVKGERSSIDPDAENCWIDTPNFSKDIAADYEVHRAACGWLFSKRRAYFRALDHVIQSRHPIAGATVAWPDALAFYEVGDFSRAALTALGVEVPVCST